MKPELYSCLKMLESFREDCIKIYNTKQWESAFGLMVQYKSIRDILKKHLNEQQMKFILVVSYVDVFRGDEKPDLIQELISASGIVISYLRSLERDLDKELREKQTELELKERELESMKKMTKTTLEFLKLIPELKRSEVVAEIKKKHREIEEHSRKKKPPEEEKGFVYT